MERIVHAVLTQSGSLPTHFSVSRVLQLVNTAVSEALPGICWVKGEVVDLSVNDGRRFFSLVEHRPGARDAVLKAVIWSDRWPPIQRRLADAGIDIDVGQEMLFGGTFKVFDDGRLSFQIREVSAEFTLGQLEAQRRAIIARLHKEDLCTPNKRLPLSAVPLRIGLVASSNTRGIDDFLTVLKGSGYGFCVLHHNVAVQGKEMERQVCDALSLLREHAASLRLDVICLVRGGGSSTDLGWWNSYAIAATAARMPVPVLCGIGHGLDRVAVDEVVHTRLTTPTAAANHLVQQVEAAAVSLASSRQAICDTAAAVLHHHQCAIEAAQSTLVDRTLGRSIHGYDADLPIIADRHSQPGHALHRKPGPSAPRREP